VTIIGTCTKEAIVARENQPKRIYLDVCILSRPFDDQSMMRIRLETDAFYLILKGIQDGLYEMAVSPVHFGEIEAIPDAVERIELIVLVEKYGVKPLCDLGEVRRRAQMRWNQFINEDELIKEAIDALMEKLGPIETNRFLSLPAEKRIESVRRHRLWQSTLDKDSFFDEVFTEH
jgi:hypothetical protein